MAKKNNNKKEIDTIDLRIMLKKRFSGNAWAFFEEVHDATGMRQRRSCDAMAMSLWPSKGLELHGFELKTSRNDWLNELRDPDKADTFKKLCDRWWLVLSHQKIAKKDEVPAEWGILWVRGDKLVVKRGATKLKPEPLNRDILAAILRRAS